MAELTLSGITKNYGDVDVIKGLDLSIKRGEFISLLGSSGCGKSTTLAMIAGLEAPTSGKIFFQDKVLASPTDGIFIEPENRQFGVVFQSYALWPHMTVEQNLAFPLKIRRIPTDEQRKRIKETLALVGLDGLEKRYPGQLSGGQQQRVGLARALVYRPQLLLLDEPLSNLDALLREQARVWLKDIQLRLGMTTIYVTHDQTEALSLSDRIVVMKNGLIEQVGSPADIYERPATPFVAEFVGSSNFLPATVIGSHEKEIRIVLPGEQVATVSSARQFADGEKVKLALRPERLKPDQAQNQTNILKVHLRRNVYVGERFSYECELEGQVLQAFGERPLPAGPVELYFAPSSASIFADQA
ncbi:ABC transporter ATP-binding protein [Rhizobium sp. SYY.PMSO]|uniref:ABC transporter ATP-binding protein n=1 Tax=Rhizobium sp. SYY.PMSO TaxID=3382192 RepID=UPI0039903109